MWAVIRQARDGMKGQAPWALAKDPEQTDRLDETLATLAEGLRALTVLLHAYVPQSAETLLAALGRPELDWAGARMGERAWEGTVEKIDPLFPKTQR